MKAKCIKADLLGWLTVGKTYDITPIGRNYIVNGTGFAVGREEFNRIFRKEP